MNNLSLKFLDDIPTDTNIYRSVVFLSRLSREISRTTMDTRQLNLVEESFREALKRKDDLVNIMDSTEAEKPNNSPEEENAESPG